MPDANHRLLAASPTLVFVAVAVLLLWRLASERSHPEAMIGEVLTDAASDSAVTAPAASSASATSMTLQEIDGLLRQKRYRRAATRAYPLLQAPGARGDPLVLLRGAMVSLLNDRELAAWYYCRLIRGIDPKIEQRHPLAADLFKIDLATRDRKVAELESALAQPEQAPLELLREFEGVPWVDALYATRQSALASEVLARARAQHALAASQLQLPLARQDARSRIDLVLVPPGRFTMGDDWGDGDDDERPVVTVEISRPFYLGKHEVTQSEWQLVMGSNPARGEHGADLPVDGVSYEDVAEFLRKTGLRLPSEAEWEYAARAGCDFKYQIGSEGMHLDRVAWHAGNAEGRAHAVLGKEPNAWGIHDLLGNVQEWCATWYRPVLPESSAADATPAGASTMRVLRGGSFAFEARPIRVSTRNRAAQTTRGAAIGFRVALDP